jgi:TPR repeat protein
MLWIALLSSVAAVVVLFVSGPSETTKPIAAPVEQDEVIPPFGATAVSECLRLSVNSKKYLTDTEMNRRIRMRLAACSEATAAAPDDIRMKVAYARALPHEERPQALALLREAAAQNDSEANFEIYESHRSWDHHLDRPQLVTRSEAEQALRKAAELDYPPAVYRMVTLLGRGDLMKRDPVAERYWLERSLQLPPPENVTRADMLIRLGAILAKSDRADERARGLDLLERLNQAGPFGAKPTLATALRASDPVRARALYEEAVRSRLGGDRSLVEMLLNGEGGPADPKRALSMLRNSKDDWSMKGLLGQLMLEGKLAPRDVPKAIDFLITAGVWDYDARLQALQLLAVHPEVSIDSADIVRYEAVQAAELDQPGAMTALIDLKLSHHPQFRDPRGACKLLATAAQRGDPHAAQRLKDCPAN